MYNSRNLIHYRRPLNDKPLFKLLKEERKEGKLTNKVKGLEIKTFQYVFFI